MAIGFPTVVEGSADPQVFEIRAESQESIQGEIWFRGLGKDVLFSGGNLAIFGKLRQQVRLDLVANVDLTFIPDKESAFFVGESYTAAFLLASYFRCNALNNILVSADCDLDDSPPDFEILPLGENSKAAIKAKASGFGHTLFMHEDDLVQAGIPSIEPEQWDRNGVLPQIVRIRQGTTLRQLAEILQVRPFDVWRVPRIIYTCLILLALYQIVAYFSNDSKHDKVLRMVREESVETREVIAQREFQQKVLAELENPQFNSCQKIGALKTSASWSRLDETIKANAARLVADSSRCIADYVPLSFEESKISEEYCGGGQYELSKPKQCAFPSEKELCRAVRCL